ncbi:MAG TPA: hypothetical protein VFU15_12910 [Bacteroidia bacterium]|nr:hypothetical protein [Bacteroidia bacterium]
MRLFLAFSLVISALSSYSQTFSGPESVEYDAQQQRWLVGNHSAQTVSAFYPASGTVVPFASGMTYGPHGLEILGSTLYCCDGSFIRGYDLATGANVFNLDLGATFLNGLTSDGSDFLFATDFSAKKIYRICPANNSFNLMATTVKTPNGILYDGAGNRCVFVTWGSNAPVQAMSLADSTISTLTTTTLSNCDGITRDHSGNWYVSAWGTNSLNMFDPAFSTAPAAVMTSLNGPADLGINTAGDSIAIPNSNATSVVFYVLNSSGIVAPSSENQLIIYADLRDQAISVSSAAPVRATAFLYSSGGTLVAAQRLDNGKTSFSGMTPGLYLVAVTDENGKLIDRRKIIYGRKPVE